MKLIFVVRSVKLVCRRGVAAESFQVRLQGFPGGAIASEERVGFWSGGLGGFPA